MKQAYVSRGRPEKIVSCRSTCQSECGEENPDKLSFGLVSSRYARSSLIVSYNKIFSGAFSLFTAGVE